MINWKKLNGWPVVRIFNRLIWGEAVKTVETVEVVQSSDAVSLHWSSNQEEITLNCNDAMRMDDEYGPDRSYARFVCDRCGAQFDASFPDSGALFKEHLDLPHDISGVM